MAVGPMSLPQSLLGYHRQLSPSAAVKVSPLCLGAMSLGTAWESFLGSVSKSTAFEILDYFYSQGGNFIDTASNYKNGQSEQWLGEWMAERGNRDEIVLATKYTSGFMAYLGDKKIQANYGGSHTKALKLSVKHSLQKLRTDYIDVLFLHWWDYSTSVPEVMHSLNDLVVEGRVHYLGVSDTPAWIVSKANEYARAHGLRPFVVYQGWWSAATRDMERDILPMCMTEQMGVTPWGALGRGSFKTKEQREKRDGRDYGATPSDKELKLSEALEKIANRKGTIMTSVALAYVMHKQAFVFPIVGGRTVEHLKSNIEALGLMLTQEDLEEIEAAEPFDRGFPHDLVGQPTHRSGAMTGDAVVLTKHFGHFDFVQPSQPVQNGVHLKNAGKAESH